MAAQPMQQDFSMAPNQALIQFLPIVPDSEYEIEKRTFSNVLHLDREQVLLAIRTRYENLQCQRRKSGARRDAGRAFITDAGNEKFGGKYPPGFRGRGRGMGRGKDRGRGRGGRKQGSDSDKSGDPKDDSVKGKRCGDVGHKAVRCPGQLCGVCGGKGHADDICANVVSILACQAPADDKTLSGEEKEAVICITSGKMSGALLLSGGRLKHKGGCALDWQVGNISVICDNGASCHMSSSSTGMINYRETKAFMKTASGTNTRSRVMEIFR